MSENHAIGTGTVTMPEEVANVDRAHDAENIVWFAKSDMDKSTAWYALQKQHPDARDRGNPWRAHHGDLFWVWYTTAETLEEMEALQPKEGDAALGKKYADEDWEQLSAKRRLIARVKPGTTARAIAQVLFADEPSRLDRMPHWVCVRHVLESNHPDVEHVNLTPAVFQAYKKAGGGGLDPNPRKGPMAYPHLIYRQVGDGGPVEVWREHWSERQKDLLEPDEFMMLERFCTRFDIPLVREEQNT